jgi:hypothetical protein
MRPSIFLLITLLLAGCSIGPRYANTRVPGVATLVENTEFPVSVEVEMIDGGIAPKAPFYLVPGSHHLSIGLSTGHLIASADADIVVHADKNYRLDVLKQIHGLVGYAPLVLRIVDAESGETVYSRWVLLHEAVSSGIPPY